MGAELGVVLCGLGFWARRTQMLRCCGGWPCVLLLRPLQHPLEKFPPGLFAESPSTQQHLCGLNCSPSLYMKRRHVMTCTVESTASSVVMCEGLGCGLDATCRCSLLALLRLRVFWCGLDELQRLGVQAKQFVLNILCYGCIHTCTARVL